MSWIAHGGLSGKNSDDGDNAAAGGGEGFSGRGIRGVPLCAEAMCSGKGMPPRRLPQPGIDCVNADCPCLPCDIVNLRLRTYVIGSQVKHAVAAAMKRYFCAVWNLVFSWLFPDHRPGDCPYLKSGDPPVNCGGVSQMPTKPGSWQKRPEPEKAAPQRTQPAQKDSRRPSAVPSQAPARSGQRSPTTSRRRRDRNGGLRYNIWNIPMPDTTKNLEAAK